MSSRLSHAELEHKAGRLQMSPTWGKLGSLADSFPLDVNDPEQMRVAFSSVTIDLIFALDEGRIRFDVDEDRALFAGLLMLGVQVVLGGKFGTSKESPTWQ